MCFNIAAFLFFTGVFAVLQIIVIAIGIEMHSLKQPVYSKSFGILFHKPVLIYFLSFAKNAAAFF